MVAIVPSTNLLNNIPFSIPSFGYGTNSTETVSTFTFTRMIIISQSQKIRGTQEKYGTIEEAVKCAIDAGYRYIDTSALYCNETEIGNAIRTKIAAGTIARQDLCIVNKLCCTFAEPANVIGACRESLRKLAIDYFDIYLMHIPSQFRYVGDEALFPLYSEPKIPMGTVDYCQTWQSMEQLIGLGLAKNIGISNGTIEQLTRIIATAQLYGPAVNHIECCPGLHQKELVHFCRDSRIIVTAYCPLGRPDFRVFANNFNADPRIQAMCRAYKKTSSQLILRYLVKLCLCSLYNEILVKFNAFFLLLPGTVSIGNRADTEISDQRTDRPVH